MNRFRTIALTAFTGFVLVACGPAASGGSNEPGPGGASQEQSQGAQASQGGPEPSFSEGLVADLEALIPDTVGDLTMQKTSMQGNQYLLDPDGDPAMLQFLEVVGVPPDNISMATGFGFNADYTSSAFMFVIRAEGADSNRLTSAFKEAMDSDAASPLEWSSANVGGKQVETSRDDSGTTYLYAKGDIVFWIFASDPEAAAEILSGLPGEPHRADIGRVPARLMPGTRPDGPPRPAVIFSANVPTCASTSVPPQTPPMAPPKRIAHQRTRSGETPAPRAASGCSPTARRASPACER